MDRTGKGPGRVFSISFEENLQRGNSSGWAGVDLGIVGAAEARGLQQKDGGEEGGGSRWNQRVGCGQDRVSLVDFLGHSRRFSGCHVDKKQQGWESTWETS